MNKATAASASPSPGPKGTNPCRAWSFGYHNFPPFVFTEHGAVMLASVLKSSVAITASINVVRAFNRLRQLADRHKDLAAALEKLERQVRSQGARLDDHAENIKALFAAIHEIMEPPPKPRKEIGFSAKSGKQK